MRLIDADKLCKDIVERGAQLSGCYSAGIARYMDRMLAHVLAEVDIAPTIDAVPRWIPGEERLPEKDGEYLCCYGRHIHIGQMIDGHFRHYGECADHLITAWMPLPEPYEGERRDDD